MAPYFVDEIEDKVGGLDGVDSVAVEFDDGYTWLPSMMSDDAHERRQQVLFERDRQIDTDEDLPESLNEAFASSNRNRSQQDQSQIRNQG